MNALVSERDPINQEQHPLLLRLPAEIRNQIYCLVLGNNSLHVYARQHTEGDSEAKVDYYTCTVPHPRKKSNSGLQHPEWLQQHMPCFTNGSTQLPNIELIFTCRQIYTETKLLSYSTNDFIFVVPSSLEIYAQHVLSPAQARALRTLSIWMPLAPGGPITANKGPTDTNTTWNSWVPSPTIVGAGLLSGIQELRLSISVFANEAGNGEWMNTREIQGLFGLMRLSSFKRVSIAVGQDEESGVVDARATVEAYAEEVRERMLGIYVLRDVVAEEE
ncbi:hypothetical protein E2P81_ATG03386 [Venturia nashicola]|nr:hypothetical protein E2P81_ATG03386 [Venturia nashicola]